MRAREVKTSIIILFSVFWSVFYFSGTVERIIAVLHVLEHFFSRTKKISCCLGLDERTPTFIDWGIFHFFPRFFPFS
jgi:hypothetical protein